MADERKARTTWKGGLIRGSGQVTVGSGGLPDGFPVTWASRAERSNGRTSPEELLAAAHASCFSMALSHTLEERGHQPERLEVEATTTFEKADGGLAVTRTHLAVVGSVPGADEDAFRDAAEAAKAGCPISKVVAGNVEVTVEARLQR